MCIRDRVYFWGGLKVTMPKKNPSILAWPLSRFASSDEMPDCVSSADRAVFSLSPAAVPFHFPRTGRTCRPCGTNRNSRLPMSCSTNPWSVFSVSARRFLPLRLPFAPISMVHFVCVYVLLLQLWDLIPGGRDVPVTNSSVISYIHLMAHFKLNVQTARPCKAFMQGFR